MSILNKPVKFGVAPIAFSEMQSNLTTDAVSFIVGLDNDNVAFGMRVVLIDNVPHFTYFNLYYSYKIQDE